jgi:molybdopterin-guanine dinucleotide biosynthesis protein A
VFAGILVGGRGRRLGGVDKARLRVRDRSSDSGTYSYTTTLMRLVSCLEGHVSQILLAGRPDQSYPEVPCRLVHDADPDAGPLAGLVALLRQAPAPWCWLLACDLPRLDPMLGRLLAKTATAADSVVVPETTRGLEPTAALYHRDTLPLAEACLERGERSLCALIQRLPHRRVRLSARPSASLVNVNRPHDLRELGEP